MPVYNYIALNEKGRRIKGRLNAANEIDLEDRLKDLGIALIEAKPISEKRSRFAGSIGIQDLIMMCIHLEQLERAGVPLLETLSDLRDSTDSLSFKNLLTDIYEAVKGGKMLSAAMAEHPNTFNSVFTGLVAAGEKTGSMADVFEHLAHHLKWVADIRRKVRKATYYPMFLLVIMFGVVALMMTFVVPKLAEFLLQQNFDLPIYTIALIKTSGIFMNYWYLLIALPIISWVTILILYRTVEPFAYAMDKFKLMVPVIGNTIRKIELARFCHFFAITFRSGISILECLEIGNNVVKNRVIRESIAAVRKGVYEGNSLTNSLRVTNEFPSIVIRMFKVGEETGNLDTSLDNVNFFFDREVNDSVNNMVGFVQPALTIVMGGIMLWVSVAVFGPLYNSFSKMQF
ncbi:MAG: type secretion system family protein [Rickettsiales bacterium]|jgi:type IV pilus assembly protein PilC|nr:type secretion system family protein [Rickettsiales bacterium]